MRSRLTCPIAALPVRESWRRSFVANAVRSGCHRARPKISSIADMMRCAELLEERRRAMRRALLLLANLLGLPGVAWGQQSPLWESWGMHPMWGMWGLWGIVMMLCMLVFWGLVVAGVVIAIRWLVQQGRGSRSGAAPEILRERYARGEIDREEFLARKRDL
jgi:putative membrane protein